MSPRTRRRVSVIVFAVMLGLALLNVVRAGLGREGWTLAGGSLAIAVGALIPILTLDADGERVTLTQRGRILVGSLALASAAALVVAGVRGGSAFVWVIVALFLTGLMLTVWGLMQQARKPAEGRPGA